jgi:AcrR family transcriptional regulator
MAETRERILTCACDLYLDDGLEGFSMRKLARNVGVTAPALYRHLQGKAVVLLDVVGEAYQTLIRYLHPALGGRTPDDRFALAGAGYMNFALEHPRYYEILYSYTEFLGLDELPEEIRKLVAGIHQFWRDRVQECMDAGILKRDDPEKVGRTFWAVSHGLLSIYHRKMLHLSEEEFREAYQGAVRQLMTGIGAEAATTRM